MQSRAVQRERESESGQASILRWRCLGVARTKHGGAFAESGDLCECWTRQTAKVIHNDNIETYSRVDRKSVV